MSKPESSSTNAESIKECEDILKNALKRRPDHVMIVIRSGDQIRFEYSVMPTGDLLQMINVAQRHTDRILNEMEEIDQKVTGAIQ